MKILITKQSTTLLTLQFLCLYLIACSVLVFMSIWYYRLSKKNKSNENITISINNIWKILLLILINKMIPIFKIK